MGFRHGIRNLTIQQQEAIVNGRAQGRTSLELGTQFNISENGISKFLKRWVDQGGVRKVPSPDALVLRLVFRHERLCLSRVKTAVDIAREICDPPNSKPSVRTIRRRLQAA
ncbi:hypothetical protein AVEN_13620-1 [Araneus ventricosus]|uniref:Paired domain-containing protein n=1 Tax=Araneus ventricosus TaxID=182803 RepID=A0A4Y2FKZ7_ARAVE|nr:hypothetical protein AVEN_13620-1 [Araneus ventricosus]